MNFPFVLCKGGYAGMEYEIKGVTITWQIENMKNIHKSLHLYSPVISMDMIDRTKWKLGLQKNDYNSILLTFTREVDENGPEPSDVLFEFSVKTLEGTFQAETNVYKHLFKKDMGNSITLWLKIGGISNRDFTPDAIIIRGKIWKPRGSILKTAQFFVRTRMKEEKCIFVGKVQNFGDFPLNEMKTLKIVSSSMGEKLMKIDFILIPHTAIFRFSYDTEHLKKSLLLIEIHPIDEQNYLFVNFKLLILDSSDNKTDIGKLEETFILSSSKLFLMHVSKEDLMKNSTLYLPKDTLSLHCEITFCSGIEIEEVKRTEYESDYIEEVKETTFSKQLEFLTSNDVNIYNTKLQTATETFLARTDILSAQSPIFDAMFQSNMKETIEGCVHIEDVDAQTVKRMLVFLYTDTLEEMKWKDTMKLYFAADKYQIISLKNRCTALLKQQLDLTNCIVLLHLADMHSDEDLKETVQHYIGIRNRHIVYFSEQWEDFENNYPILAMRTFYPYF